METTEQIEEPEKIQAKLTLDPRLLEAVAEFEHEQWMAWAKNLLEREPNISQERKARWQKLFVPYAELSEEMKEADREWARGVGKIFLGAIMAGVFAVPETPQDPKT